MEKLFEQYTSLRLQGYSAHEAEINLINGIQRLSVGEQVSLKQRFLRWDSERTEAELNATERMKLSNITMKIVFCPSCESPNVTGIKDCQVCGTSLQDIQAENLNDVETVVADLSETEAQDTGNAIVLYSTRADRQFALRPRMKKHGLRLGRYSASNEVEIDLNELGAIDLGVSRLHALIEYDDELDAYYISDLGSTNGTFVNDIRLPANARSRLRDGDEIGLGRLSLNIRLGHVSSP